MCARAHARSPTPAVEPNMPAIHLLAHSASSAHDVPCVTMSSAFESLVQMTCLWKLGWLDQLHCWRQSRSHLAICCRTARELQPSPPHRGSAPPDDAASAHSCTAFELCSPPWGGLPGTAQQLPPLSIRGHVIKGQNTGWRPAHELRSCTIFLSIKPLFLTYRYSIALQTTEDHRAQAVGMYKGLQSAKLRLQNMGISKRTVVGTIDSSDAFKLVRFEIADKITSIIKP